MKDEGAERVIAYITHPVLSGKAVERIENSALDQLVVTDTIPLGEAARKCKRIRVLSVAELLAETMLLAELLEGRDLHQAAGAVHLGAVEAGEGVDDLAVPGDHDRRRGRRPSSYPRL